MRRSPLFAVAALAFLVPGTATAQKFEITPFFASHYSLSPYMDENFDVGGSLGTERVTERTGRGPAVGARLTYWLKPTLGLEVEGVYSDADQENQFPDRDPAATGERTGESYNASVQMFSGRVLYRPRRSNLRVFAGVSSLTFGGDVYDFAAYNYTNLSTVGAVLGFGVRAQATRSLALDVAIEAYLHSLDRGDGPWPVALTAKPQQELLVTVGVPIKLKS